MSVAQALHQLEPAVVRHPIRIGLGMAALAALVVRLMLHPNFDSGDDVAMMWIVDGTTYGSPAPHTVFSSALVGEVLSTLYRAAPGIPWYPLYLYGLHAVVAGVVGYLVAADTRTHPGPRLAALGGILGLFLVPMWLDLQFTSVSLLLGAVGILLFASRSHLPRSGRWAPLVGGLMLGAAALVRWRSFQGAILLLLPVVVIAARRIAVRRIAMFAGTAVVLVLAGTVVETAVQGDDWQDWIEFNSARGDLHGSRTLPAAAGHPILDEIGWSSNDLAMFREWFFVDETVYTTGALEAIGDSVDPGPSGFAVAGQLRGGLRLMRVGFLAGMWLWALSVVRRNGGIHLTIAGAWVALVAGYLLAFGRFPDRVSVPILTIAALILVTLPAAGPAAEAAGWRRRTAMWLPVLLGGAGLVVGIAHLTDADGDSAEGHRRMVAAIDGMREHDPDGVFVAQGTVLRKGLLSPLRTGDVDLPAVVPLGWQTNSPLHRDLRDRLGVADIYSAIADDPRVYLAANPTVDPALFAIYMREHHGRTGRLRPVARIDTVILYDTLVDLTIAPRGAVEAIGTRERSLGETGAEAVPGQLEIGPGRRQRGRVRGWAAAPGAEVDYVAILTGGRLVAIVLPSEARPDEAAAVGVAAETPLGFAYDFDGPVPGDLEVAVVVGDSVRVLD